MATPNEAANATASFRPRTRFGADDSHVADVERSAEFYRLLGFEVGNKVPTLD